MHSSRPHIFPAFLAVALLLMTMLPPAPGPVLAGPGGGYGTEGQNRADSAMIQGATAYAKGGFSEAIRLWELAADLYGSGGNTARQVEALCLLADGFQATGRIPRAAQYLDQARTLAAGLTDPVYPVRVDAARGYLLYLDGKAVQAGTVLRSALLLAREHGYSALTAAILNNLGTVLASRNKYDQALAAYGESIRISRADNNRSLLAKALVNISTLHCDQGHYDRAVSRLGEASRAINRLENSHAKAYLLISAGKLYTRINDGDQDRDTPDRNLLGQAFQLFTRAEKIAADLHDSATISHALGNKGALYEREHRYDEALELTRRALFIAQQDSAPEILYQWQWQVGRLLKAKGDLDGAVSSYRRALFSLAAIRQDLAAGCNKGTTRLSFRATVGPIYFGLADLLLQRSSRSGNEKKALQDLRYARQVIEQLKAVELQDYFQDDCITALQSRETSLQGISNTMAAIYPVILPDRLELLVNFPDGLKQYIVPVRADKLTRSVRRLRKKLETPGSRYLVHAQNLYNWLIRPLEADLKASGVDTLIMVPDGPLRTVPMAVLHDGQEFLINNYAVVTTPGLTLIDPRPFPRTGIQLLLNGLTRAVQGFPALPNVGRELAEVEKIYSGKVLRDASFTSENVAKELEAVPYSVIHIASHGQFDNDPKKSFLLTYRDKLTMDRLEELLRLSKFRKEPVELLVLSACQTAAGDDRAALGLAGVAIKAGARSALASLWFVNDAATSRLVTEFYRQLRNPELNKAQALQQAQLLLLEQPQYRHPAFWSPFLLIGNWL